MREKNIPSTALPTPSAAVEIALARLQLGLGFDMCSQCQLWLIAPYQVLRATNEDNENQLFTSSSIPNWFLV